MPIIPPDKTLAATAEIVFDSDDTDPRLLVSGKPTDRSFVGKIVIPLVIAIAAILARFSRYTRDSLMFHRPRCRACSSCKRIIARCKLRTGFHSSAFGFSRLARRRTGAVVKIAETRFMIRVPRRGTCLRIDKLADESGLLCRDCISALSEIIVHLPDSSRRARRSIDRSSNPAVAKHDIGTIRARAFDTLPALIPALCPVFARATVDPLESDRSRGNLAPEIGENRCKSIAATSRSGLPDKT